MREDGRLRTEVDPHRWWGLGEVVRLAVPSTLNALSLTLMQFVDGYMVSRLGPEAMGAQVVGGMTSFVAACFFMGILACVNTFAAQCLGAGRPEEGPVYAWQGLWLALVAGGTLGVAGLLLAPRLFALFGHEPAVAALETTYFRILIAGVGMHLAARAIGNFFIGVHLPIIAFVAGATGNLVNVLMNYVLIFGKLGFPALGLEGAAIGTVIGFSLEALILAAAFLVGPLAVRFRTREACRFDRKALLELLRIGSPAGATFFTDILMWTLFMSVVIGSFGARHLAATAILWRYWHLCFMPAIGVGVACTALVGRYGGAGRTDLAWRRAHVALGLVEAYMVTVGLGFWMFRDRLVGLFNHARDPIVQTAATDLFLVLVVCQAFDALMVVFMSALRGAGDTFWPGVVQVGLAWGVGFGGAMIMKTYFSEYGILGAWTCPGAYIVLVGLALWVRFLRGAWKEKFVVRPAPSVPEEAPGIPPV